MSRVGRPAPSLKLVWEALGEAEQVDPLPTKPVCSNVRRDDSGETACQAARIGGGQPKNPYKQCHATEEKDQ